MAPLAIQFDAALLSSSPPSAAPTPVLRLPIKEPPPVSERTKQSARASPMRSMMNVHLLDSTNNVDLGIVLAVDRGGARITTNLTTVCVRNGRVVRGRINKRALYGVRVVQWNPFAEP